MRRPSIGWPCCGLSSSATTRRWNFFQQLIDIDPSAAAAHGDMGLVLFYLGRSAEALQSFDQALSLDPTLENARANRTTYWRRWKKILNDEIVVSYESQGMPSSRRYTSSALACNCQ